MNTKDRKDYRRNQRALLKHLSRARNAIAELDALTHGTKPTMHHTNVRNLRELLGLGYGMALDTRLELWLQSPQPPETGKVIKL